MLLSCFRDNQCYKCFSKMTELKSYYSNIFFCNLWIMSNANWSSQINQKKTVNVIRFVIFNFHAMFREYWQLNKSVMNFADWNFFNIMQIFLIKLLNETNKKFLIMHQFSQEQKLLTDQNFDSFSFYKYLMSESKFFQFFTINFDEILLKN